MDDSIRRRREDWERETLSPFAALSAETRGRPAAITPCTIRTEFVRDRDRILHCKAFRRLKHKTQVFLAPQGDHYRTRLTHTLEVSQTGRTIARALLLNEDLTEAIAMGHDLGHTPFGHAGESVLNELIPGGFSHNEQSLRVVDLLENDGRGLNLTYEVRDGILNHTSKGTPATCEGKVLSYADRIAYINHDIDDAIRAGVLTAGDIPASCSELFGYSHGQRINSMILDIVKTSTGSADIRFSADAAREFTRLREFMFANVYLNPAAKHEEGRAMRVMKELFGYYLEHSHELPPEYIALLSSDSLERVVGDYIAGMTDNYAIAEFQRLYVPRFWSIG